MSKLRAGVIGLGVGAKHAEGYCKLDNVDLVSVCDLDLSKAHNLTQQLDNQNLLHGKHIQVYENAHEMLDKAKLDVVSICGFDDSHYSCIRKSIENDIHIMVEKPAVLYPEELYDIVERLQQKSHLVFTSNLVLRAVPRFRRLKKLIQEGAFGKIFYIEGDYVHDILWKLTTGWRREMSFYCVVYGGGIHLLDLMSWLLDDNISQVSAYGNNLLTKNTGFNYPDTIVSLLQFSSGILGKSLTSLGSARNQIHNLTIHGQQKCFVNDIPHATLHSKEDRQEKITDDYPNYQKYDLLSDFINAIYTNTQAAVTSLEVFRIMEVCFSIWESVQIENSVKVKSRL